ncbi:hypothetical protein [Sinorhizobium meliloti]|uniref:hypothetical protein n=1 Tax=Rhizobium meliloti TaxID=382 RepID=UPI0020BDC188|nr:hypothetical protein [Sinorhizobium meliloti]
MSERKGQAGRAVPKGKIERYRLTAENPGFLNPEDAKAYAESLLEAALYGPNAYLPEGPRKPLGRLSKDPRDEDANAPGPRVGQSGLQKNLEDVKNELKFLLPKVSNEAGVAELNSIISSIQAVQDLTDDNRRKWLYEYPYRNQPNFYDEQKETFGNFGVPSGRLITQDEDPWQKGQISAPLGPTMTP